MKLKKVVAASLVFVMTAALMTGCSKSEGGENSGESSGGKTKIRFASWDTAESLESQEKLVKQFNESQDKIEVSIEGYGSDYDTKISAGMGSGDSPDVMYMWNYPAYYKGLEPLDSYMEKEGEEFKSSFYDTLWDYNKLDDKTYGIPVGFTTHCLYYNKDIFDKAGVAYPTAEWTWDDLQKASKTITEKGEGAKGYTFPMKADPYDFEMYLWSNGSSYVDKDGKLDGNLNNSKSVEAFEVFQNMEKEEIAIASEKNGVDEFTNGKAAMFTYGSWGIKDLNEAGVNYGIIEIPSFASAGKKSVSILSSSGVSISSKSKNKEAAWEFVKYWTGEEMNKARIGTELPTRESVVVSEKIMEDEKNAPFYRMLEQSQGYTPTSFIVDEWSELAEKLSLSFERIFNPSSLEKAQEVLDEAVKQ